MTEFLSPVARMVQGGCTLQDKKDMKTGQPVRDDQGNVIKETFIAIAIRKDDPGLMPFYNLFVQTARAEFPHLFDAQGQCTHQRFAWKIQDGDGRDQNGQSVANKPGFAGHYIFKMTTRFAPKCFHYGKYDVSQQIQNPDDVIKKGYFVRVGGTISGNGVKPQDGSNVPGLFVSQSMIELVAFGEEIQTGPDASAVFGAAPITGALPPGASQTPILPAGGAPAGGLTPPALPGMGGGVTPAALPTALPGAAVPVIGAVAPVQTAAAALPAIGAVATPAALPSLPGAGALPSLQPAGPQYAVSPAAAAQGVTLEQLLGQGHKIEALVANGYAVQVA